MDLLTKSDKVMLNSSRYAGGEEFVNDLTSPKMRGFITPCERCGELAHHTFILSTGAYSCDNCGYLISSVSVSILMQRYADTKRKSELAAYNKLTFWEKLEVYLRGGLFNCMQ